MRKEILIIFGLLMLSMSTASAYNELDGKITEGGVHNLIYVSIFLFVFSFIMLAYAKDVSAISIVLLGLSVIMDFHIAEVYLNGSLVEIMPDSTIEIMTNASTSQFWQLFGIFTMLIMALEVIMLVIAKRKPIFTANENFGDGLE